ncbi:hypothetical protein TURU_039308 [Turdus rufiventris]|nr:hypothetical protein TURU_039308 [Turdus rufiventris]
MSHPEPTCSSSCSSLAMVTQLQGTKGGSREHPDAGQGSPEAWSTREPQQLLSLSGGPGLDPRVLLQLPNSCLSPCGASGPPDSQGGQQQGKCSQHGATVTHGSGTAQHHCTGSCSHGDGTELAQRWGQDTV